MDRVFLDANVLFSAAYSPGRRIGRLWRLKGVELVTSPYAAAEALRNIARKSPDRVRALLKLLSKTRLVAEPTSSALPPGVALPEKDVQILLAAVDGAATHLLTGDHDFDPYFGQTIGGVTILRPAEYLQGH